MSKKKNPNKKTTKFDNPFVNKGKPKFLELKDKLLSIYNTVNLETTCPGHCVCCSVACPQMNYSEFLIIVNRIYDKFAKEKRMEILKKSIKYFFSNSLVKPCPLLDGKKCSIYEVRPLNCRMFGLWPEDSYEERVQRFMKVTGLKKEEIPLNTQCKYVKRVDESQPLTKEIIEKMYEDINNLDIGVGNFTKEQIEKRYNQRTWHDWFMVNVFGEVNLSDLSRFFLAAENQEVLDDFVTQMCKQVDSVGDLIFKRRK